MDIKNFLKYNHVDRYKFSIAPETNNNTFHESSTMKLYKYLDQNAQYIKNSFNYEINSDIIIREFLLNCRNVEYNAFIIYIDGMVSTDSINHFILNPLMLKNQNNTFNGNLTLKTSNQDNSVSAQKVKKVNLVDYVYNSLVPQNSVNKVQDFSGIISAINSGDCALFIDTIDTCFDIDVKGFKQRSIQPPTNEIVIKGPQESFVENIRTNTSLLRRIINNENLVIESVSVGKISQTKCAICYVNNIVNDDLLNEVKYRLNNLGVDSIVSTGQLEQLIEDTDNLDIPHLLSTERPDRCAKGLLQGRVVILINGNPYALIAPAIFKDFLTSTEDTNLKVLFANFLKVIRFVALFITLLLPGMYIAVTSFHQEIVPTELLFSILAARQDVPFPIIFELLIMEFSFELIREGGLRIPSPIGSTMGIVGALILGDAAVNANIVSPILIIVVAITGLSSFAIPDFYYQFHARVYRFFFILLGYASGFLGISLGIVAYLTLLCSIQSFGVQFTSSFETSARANHYFLSSIWKREYRNDVFASKISRRQEPISKKWKFKN